jgi:hypothetical protein
VEPLFLSISLYLNFNSIYNFDHDEREEKESCIDETAQTRGVYGMLGKGVAQNFGVWSNQRGWRGL